MDWDLALPAGWLAGRLVAVDLDEVWVYLAEVWGAWPGRLSQKKDHKSKKKTGWLGCSPGQPARLSQKKRPQVKKKDQLGRGGLG